MAKKDFLKYRAPEDWLRYDPAAIVTPLTQAEAARYALIRLPYAGAWLEKSRRREWKAEIAATCSLGGLAPGTADMEFALSNRDRPPTGTRTANATWMAARAYEWIESLPDSFALDPQLILELHSRLATEEDAGRPGTLRNRDEEIFFGSPRQRGAKGGKACEESLRALVQAVTHDQTQPLVVKGLALHYHLLSIHPFADANGRTARALDAIFRQSSGLAGAHFVSLSTFYLAEKETYVSALSASRTAGHNLTPFLEFALSGLASRCGRILDQVSGRVATALFEKTVTDLFGELAYGKRRAMAARQVRLLQAVIETPGTEHHHLYEQLSAAYSGLKNPWKAFQRDMRDLLQIEALRLGENGDSTVHPCLEWPRKITKPLFAQYYRDEPRAGIPLPPAV